MQAYRRSASTSSCTPSLSGYLPAPRGPLRRVSARRAGVWPTAQMQPGHGAAALCERRARSRGAQRRLGSAPTKPPGAGAISGRQRTADVTAERARRGDTRMGEDSGRDDILGGALATFPRLENHGAIDRTRPRSNSALSADSCFRVHLSAVPVARTRHVLGRRRPVQEAAGGEWVDRGGSVDRGHGPVQRAAVGRQGELVFEAELVPPTRWTAMILLEALARRDVDLIPLGGRGPGSQKVGWAAKNGPPIVPTVVDGKQRAHSWADRADAMAVGWSRRTRSSRP